MIIDNIELFEKTIKTLKKSIKAEDSIVLTPTTDLGPKNFCGTISDFSCTRADYDTCFIHRVEFKYTVQEKVVALYPFFIALARAHKNNMEGWSYFLEYRKDYIFQVLDYSASNGSDDRGYIDFIFELRLDAMEKK